MSVFLLSIVIIGYLLYRFHRDPPRIRKLGGNFEDLASLMAFTPQIQKLIFQNPGKSAQFSNWEGRNTCLVRSYQKPTTKEEVQQILKEAYEKHEKVRVVGAGHSWGDSVITNDHLISLDNMKRIISIDHTNLLVTVEGGIRLYELTEILEREGLSLYNIGTIKEQSLAGVVSTATHGTGQQIGSFSSTVRKIEFVTVDKNGEPKIMQCSGDENSEIFKFGRCCVGTFGVITELTIQVKKLYRVRQEQEVIPIDTVYNNFYDWVKKEERIKFWWFVPCKFALTSRYYETNDEISPLKVRVMHYFREDFAHYIQEWALYLISKFPSLNEKVITTFVGKLPKFVFTDKMVNGLNSVIRMKHCELEYIVDSSKSLEIMKKIEKMIADHKICLNMPVEVRFTKGDDIPLSPMYGRDSTCFTFLVYNLEDHRVIYFEQLDKIFSEYGGRPHWGKWFGLTCKELQILYPEWNNFLAARSTTTTSMTQESNLSVVIKSLTAGTFAGMAQVFIGHPLDTVKTRLQTQDAANPRYKGGWDCFSKTLQQEGVRGLYKGMASPFFGAAFINAILFGAYGHFRHSAMQKNNTTDLSRVPIRDIFVAGGLAGLVNTVVAGPIELIKTKLQLQFNNPQQKALYAGPIDCAKKMYQINGVPGLFKGMVPTILREIPAYASFYGVFEFMKRRLTPEGKSVKDLPLYSLMFAGSCGGIAYWCSCYPFDVIKSRIQGQSDMQPLYKGTLDCAQKIIKTEGYAGLFRGFAPAIVRTIPAAAATFTTFELAMQVLNK